MAAVAFVSVALVATEVESEGASVASSPSISRFSEEALPRLNLNEFNKYGKPEKSFL